MILIAQFLAGVLKIIWTPFILWFAYFIPVQYCLRKTGFLQKANAYLASLRHKDALKGNETLVKISFYLPISGLFDSKVSLSRRIRLVTATVTAWKSLIFVGFLDSIAEIVRFIADCFGNIFCWTDSEKQPAFCKIRERIIKDAVSYTVNSLT